MANKKVKITVISIIVALVLLFGIACLLRFVGDNMQTDKDLDGVEVTVSNEADLREMLLKDATMTIEVTDDMVIEEGFVVNGQKTLKGDAVIQMYIGAAFDQAILTVSPDATLTMDGLVLDGNHLSDGIMVSDGAKLTYLSGKMIYTETFGIIAKGDTTIKDITMEHAQEGTVKVCSGATVSMEGGNYLDTWYGGVHIEKDGNLTISGDTFISGSVVQSMVHNEGNLKVTGGTFSNSGAYAIRNYGQLDMAYEGDKEDGYIEFTSNSRAAIRTEDGAVSNISDMYVHDTRSNALVAVGGESNITDSRIEKTADHAIEIQKGTATIKNVTATETSAGGGIYAGPSSNVEVENFTATKVASNGIGCKSGTVTGTKVTVISPGRYGIACGNSTGDEIGKVTITDSEITDAGKFGVYVYGSSDAKIVDTKISGFTKEETTGIFVASKASCTLEGDSIIETAKQRGVKVLGTFTMNGGKICNNISPLNGAGMYVGPVAVFTMNGGEISKNVNATRNAGGMIVDGGKVTIAGGKILNNSTSKAGGAIYAYNGATVYLKSGEIDGNIAGISGDGIYFKGEKTKVTVGKNFFMGSNDIRVATTEVMLDIESGTLSKHSVSKPLLVTPGDTFEEGTKVVRCSNAAAATKLNGIVKSGDGSFKLNKNDKYYEIEYTKADMDMTGADTVYVSDFEELKAAVEGTSSKRYIVLKANIAMESQIRVPGGTTVCIKDDGKVRKLTRAEGMTDKFFTTLYGTGLYLEGTTAGNLILDGTCSDEALAKDCQSLVYTAGSTVVKGAVLRNNGAAIDGSKGRGVLLNQWYGDVSIYDSLLSGGKGYTGGALIVSNASGYIENSIFKNNKSIVGGGAIRMEKGAKLEVVSSTFVGNTAGSTGGAIVSTDAKKLTVTDTTFDSNTAKKGGAVGVVGTDNYAFFNGSEGSDVALFTNNSVDNGEEGKGGAIYAEDTVQVVVDGYNFTKNSASGYGGAVHAKHKTSSVVLTNSTFYENTVGNSGAAVASEGSTIDIISCEIGKENAGNVAASKGGAVIVYGNGTIRMSLGGGSDYKTLAYNEAKVGGAICVFKGSFYLDGYTIANNSARDGAGMYVYANGAAETSNATFKANEAQKDAGAGGVSNYGGAVCVYGTLKSTDDTYEANTARVGGGIFVSENASAEFSGTSGLFTGNRATGSGGAIYVHNSAKLTVDGYSFTKNVAEIGGAVYTRANTTAILKNSTFYENIANDSGAAIACYGSQMDIINCEIGKENAGNVAASKGGAVIVLGDGTVRMSLEGGSGYQTVAYNSANAGGAICVYGGSFYADGYTFANNIARNGAGIYIYADNVAETSNVTFKANEAQKDAGADGVSNYGGAVCSYGEFKSTDDTYEANVARVGGAVFVAENTSAKFSGTTGLFKGNTATNISGAIHAHTKATITVDGHTFEDNHAKSGNAVRVYPQANATIANCVFTDTDGTADIANSGTTTFNNLTGATLVQITDTAMFVVSGSVAENSQLAITPKEYAEGTVVLAKADGLSDEAWTSAYTNIAVTAKSDGTTWEIDEEGKLQSKAEPVASITSAGVTNYYYSLQDAVTAADEIGSTGDEPAIEITLLKDVVLEEAISITSLNLIIQNKANTNVKISRGSNFTGNMFGVNSNATLQLGTSNAADTGKLIVDGGSTSVSGRTIYVSQSSSTFVLQKNAVLQNAVSTSQGSVIANKGKCELYGTIQNNISSNTTIAGAILQCRGSKELIIYDGYYAGNTNSETNADVGGGFIAAQNASSGTVGNITIKGGTFENNSADHGGVIETGTGTKTYGGTNITIEGGLFQNNSATNGGVVYLNSYGTLTIKGGTFQGNNATANGGVIATSSDAGTVTIEGGSFTSNNATEYGGIAHVNTTNLFTISGGTFTSNKASTGGVVATMQGTTTANASILISGGTYTQNSANAAGVIYAWNRAQLTITSGAFTNNEAKTTGAGAIFVGDRATATISGTTMTGNCAPYNKNYYGGGAIALHGGATVTISNCQISNNTHSGRLSAETKNENGVDIAFSGQGSNKTQKLILKDATSFNGIIGQIFKTQNAALQVVFGDESVETVTTRTVDYSTRYNVNLTEKKLEEIQ